MLHNAQNIASGGTLQGDLCIIGAGAAGISIAREFAGRPQKVILLESGGFQLEEPTQQLYAGSYDGPFTTDGYLIGSRLRYFGGTTNHWGGSVRPLDPIDFIHRDWVPHSGWPIDRTQLWPFYDLAAKLVRVPPFSQDGEEGQQLNANPFEQVGSPALLAHKFVLKSKPVRFGSKYGKDLMGAENLEVVINANVTRIHTREGRVRELDVTSLDGPPFKVMARRFVLATGGLENARMLLTSNLGNEHDNVGRYYMDHPHLRSCGLIMWRDRLARKAFINEQIRAKKRSGCGIYSVFTPSARRQQELKVLNCGVRIKTKYEGESPPLEREMMALTGFGELSGILPIDSLMLYLEHAPHRQSRIRLGTERDPLGLSRLVVEWRPDSLVAHTISQLMNIFAGASGGLGRARVRHEIVPAAFQNHTGSLSAHPSGTTRMSEDPVNGVVDVNCRIHRLENLYVAGSSVFPTGGFANPTLTIVALALRLSHHLKEAFDRD